MMSPKLIAKRTSVIEISRGRFRPSSRIWVSALRQGLNIVEGKVSYRAVAETFGLLYVAAESFL